MPNITVAIRTEWSPCHAHFGPFGRLGLGTASRLSGEGIFFSTTVVSHRRNRGYGTRWHPEAFGGSSVASPVHSGLRLSLHALGTMAASPARCVRTACMYRYTACCSNSAGLGEMMPAPVRRPVSDSDLVELPIIIHRGWPVVGRRHDRLL